METLQILAEELGVQLHEDQLQQLMQYYEMLIEKNKVMNLTAITEKEEVLKKHFIDSLSIGKFVQFDGQCTSVSHKNVSRETFLYEICKTEGKVQKNMENQVILPKQCRMLDLGTGAGFPGIPLKIAYPNLSVVLADSLNKRILFLREVVEALGLCGIEAVHGRAEELARQQEYRELFDLCVSRAVAKISVLAEYCLPFVKVGGFFAAYKAPGCEEELEEGKRAISVLGGKIKMVQKLMLPQSDIGRVLIFIEKVKPTGKKYPRMAGKPAASPIIG